MPVFNADMAGDTFIGNSLARTNSFDASGDMDLSGDIADSRGVPIGPGLTPKRRTH